MLALANILLWCPWTRGRKISVRMVSEVSSSFRSTGWAMKAAGLFCDRTTVWCRPLLSSGLRIKFSSRGVGL